MPLGSWAGLFWPEVHVQWKNQGRPSRRAASSSAVGNWGSPEASRSMPGSSSGANGTSPATSAIAMHQDGAGVKDVCPAQRRLAGAMAVELTAGDFEKVPDADKAALAARIDKAEIMALVADLERRGYERRLPISGGRRQECSAMSEEGCFTPSVSGSIRVPGSGIWRAAGHSCDGWPVRLQRHCFFRPSLRQVQCGRH